MCWSGAAGEDDGGTMRACLPHGESSVTRTQPGCSMASNVVRHQGGSHSSGDRSHRTAKTGVRRPRVAATRRSSRTSDIASSSNTSVRHVRAARDEPLHVCKSVGNADVHEHTLPSRSDRAVKRPTFPHGRAPPFHVQTHSMGHGGSLRASERVTRYALRANSSFGTRRGCFDLTRLGWRHTCPHSEHVWIAYMQKSAGRTSVRGELHEGHAICGFAMGAHSQTTKYLDR
jgi:hypothetical protein